MSVVGDLVKLINMEVSSSSSQPCYGEEADHIFKKVVHSRSSFFVAMSIFAVKPRIFSKKWKASKLRGVYITTTSIDDVKTVQEHVKGSSTLPVTQPQIVNMFEKAWDLDSFDHNVELSGTYIVHRDYIGLNCSCPEYEIWGMNIE